MTIRAVVLVLTLCSLPTPARAQVRDIAVGSIHIGGRTLYVELDFVDGRADFPLERRSAPVEQETRHEGGVRITIARPDGALVLTGASDAAGMRGVVAGPEGAGTFELLRLGPFHAATFHAITGNYALGDDTLTIGQLGDLHDLPLFLEHGSRRIGPLVPLSDSVFIAGPGIGVHVPVRIRATVRRDDAGRVSSLLWERTGRLALEAQPLRDYDEEAVVIPDPHVSLGATLYLPAGPGPHPAIVNVMGPGGGDGSRNIGETAPFLAGLGLAVLIYDKRGTGDSGGPHWREARVEDLAEDVLRAVRWLRGRPDIDPDRIGLWATSNGGWVAPVALARSSDIAFAILRSPGVLPPGENVIFEVESDLRAAGLPEETIARGVALRRQFTHAVLTGTGWQDLAREIRSVRDSGWIQIARVPAELADLGRDPRQEWQRAMRTHLAFDPAPWWRSVRQPVLAVFGGMDRSIPAGRSRDLLVELAHENVSVMFLPDANHVMLEASRTGPRHGARYDTNPLDSHAVQGYHDALRAWIADHVLRDRRD